jgi:hypothetical protein
MFFGLCNAPMEDYVYSLNIYVFRAVSILFLYISGLLDNICILSGRVNLHGYRDIRAIDYVQVLYSYNVGSSSSGFVSLRNLLNQILYT